MMKNLTLFFVMLTISSNTVAAEKQNWIFVTKMPGKKEQKSDFWQVTADHKFEIAGNEVLPFLYTYTFNEMIQEAKNKNVPFFLVLLTSKDHKGNDVMNVFNGEEAFQFLMEKWKTTEWYYQHADTKKPAHFQDPMNLLIVENITIFVMGDDGKFTKLKDNVDDKFLSKFVNQIKVMEDFTANPITVEYTYKIKNVLNKKGEAQLFVAELFKEQAQKEVAQKQLLQHARQWYEWALKYLPKNNTEYIRAQSELNKILEISEPQKPKKPTQPKTVPISLIQNLRNLTRALQQISTFLI